LAEFFDSCSKELGFEPEGDTSLFEGCSKPVITYNENSTIIKTIKK
jgi:hypothetical protein